MPQAETTTLSPDEERQFQAWVSANKTAPGVRNYQEAPYDMRGFWQDKKARAAWKPGEHFPDTYKQHGHPTFSVESKYSKGPNDGGRWEGETFVPPVMPKGFVPDGFEPDAGPNLSAVGGDTIRGEDPNAPGLMRRLQDALGHAAQPDSVGDFLSLVIPSGAGQAATDIKDMARIFRQALKESPSLKGVLPRINQIIKERPKSLQDFQSQGFNRLPLAQQMEHLPEVPAPPGRMPAPLPTIAAPVETTPAVAESAAPVTAGASAARTLTAEERQAVDALVQQGYTESDVLAQLDKLKTPSTKFTPSAIKLKMNAAETKQFLRLQRTGKTADEAAALVKAERELAKRLGTPDSETVRRKVMDRNATGRWED